MGYLSLLSVIFFEGTLDYFSSHDFGIVFLTLEDETGNTNVVVWKSTLDRYRSEILQRQLLLIQCTIEREGEGVHVVAGNVQDLTYKLARLSTSNQNLQISSRNFH